MGKKIFLVFICITLFLTAFIYVEKVKADLPGGPGDYCWVDASNGQSGRYYFYKCDSPDCDEEGPSSQYCAVFSGGGPE